MKRLDFVSSSVVLVSLALSFQARAQWSTDPAENTRVNDWGLNPRAVSDGEGGAIVFWERNFTLPQGRDIYAQRIDHNGYLLWPEGGVAVCTEEFDQMIYYGDVVSDGSGGAYVAWTDYRRSTREYDYRDSIDVYLQHVNSDGQVLWQRNGILISTGYANARAPRLVSDGVGGVIVGWDDYRNRVNPFQDPDVYAQRVNAEGDFLWGANSVLLADFTKVHNMIEDSQGGTIIVIYKEGVFRIDDSGIVLWNSPEGGGI